VCLLELLCRHKGYHCLDLSTNRLIVSRHVVFYEDNFPLTASLSLTDLDFLCESAPTIFTIGTHLTTADTSPPTPHRSAQEIPPGFEPPVANLPAPAVHLGFLPLAATTATPPPITIAPPTRTWPALPITYVRREVGAGATGTRGAPRPAPSPEVGTGAAGPRGTPGATLRREVVAGAAGTRGAPGAALRREVGTGATPRAALSRAEGTGATGTLGAPGPAPSPEVAARATRTHGAPGATLRREVGAGAAGTHGGPGAALSREVGARAVGTRGSPRAALSREPGTTPPPLLRSLRRAVRAWWYLSRPQIIHIG
jgi:hypothetical protein